ncbi:hypothetical protein BDFB_009684 [Asbolus verrucosus]|uniref:Uncharacterized protein n=1 Tax=Asbolus verrucosus TaxID=1661398 RepID=A0A482VSD4_ASBVE|nr:hypothetical protein BDFB_009684 [Asbolus verrucosus]
MVNSNRIYMHIDWPVRKMENGFSLTP